MEKIDITHLVPKFILGDQNGWALAKAIEVMLNIFHEKVQEEIDAALNPDKMPEWRLDEVAREENIFWYDFHADESIKRGVIKNANRTYSLLGTKTGTEDAARDFCSDAVIKEWFEYGGEPGSFRVYARSGDAATHAVEMIKSINEVKRLTSTLDGIHIDYPPLTARAFAGIALYNGRKMIYRMDGVDTSALPDNWLTDETGEMLLDERSVILFE